MKTETVYLVLSIDQIHRLSKLAGQVVHAANGSLQPTHTVVLELQKPTEGGYKDQLISTRLTVRASGSSTLHRL